MRNHETGEYEVVVGNAQLLTAFGIVVLLCGAAFFMGYEVGQNAPHVAKMENTAPAPAQDASTQPAQTYSPQTQTSQAPPQTSDAAPVDTPPQPTTVAERDASSAPAAAPAPAPPAAAPLQPAPAPQVTAMPPGSYCQAMAAHQASDAQSLLRTLKDGGMPATLQNGSDGLVRVMVGPYQDRAGLSQAKTELETRFQIRGPICK
ncbi:MAG TPA: SPOR domain-containing protein [Bryobacteraceae bacterium]|nr:SPOR domain-containing protein [Bryobacteraceae bacterium]